jgi:hypothetical protein
MPEPALQVSWNKVTLNFPRGHENEGQALTIDRDAIVPDWLPAEQASLLVTIGALRRVVVLEDSDTGMVVTPTAIAGKLSDLLAAGQGTITGTPKPPGEGGEHPADERAPKPPQQQAKPQPQQQKK